MGSLPPPYSPKLGQLERFEQLSLDDAQDCRVPFDWLAPSREPTGSPSSGIRVPQSIRDELYPALNARPGQFDIRLIEIERHDSDDGLMSCILLQMPLEDAPEYYALSYHWGEYDSNAEQPLIMLNGYEFPVQPNLFDALHALRKRGYCTVWADAICLNQSDDLEKAQQVPRMKTIYQRARGVAIWIGQEEDGSHEVIQLLRDMASNEVTQEFKQFFSQLQPVLGDEFGRTLLFSKPFEYYEASCAHALLDGRGLTTEELQRYPKEEVTRILKEEAEVLVAKFDAFFGRPYWRRMWIIQEVAASRSAAILCGDDLLRWDDLASVGQILDNHKVDHTSPSEIGTANIQMIRKLRYSVQSRKPIGLLTALQRSFTFSASRIQDCIYAVLGLSWDADRLIYTVSYAKEFTVNRIMFDMTRNWMKDGYLDVICLQPTICNSTALPSWLPKWLDIGRSAASERLVDFIESRRPLSLRSTFGHSWQATKRSHSLRHQVLDNGRVLLVRGFHVDTIDGLSQACEYDSADPSLRRSWNSRQPPPKDVKVMKAIRQDLYDIMTMYKVESANGILDQTLDLDVLWDEDTKQFFVDEELNDPLDWLEALRFFHIYGRTFEQWLLQRNWRKDMRNAAKIFVLNEMVTDAHHFVNSTTHPGAVLRAFQEVFTNGRRLMTTKAGRVGWAHPTARPGDRIFLLEGCSLPVILTPCDEMFETYHTCILRGDAYVHRIMHGEIWEEVKGGLYDIFLR